MNMNKRKLSFLLCLIIILTMVFNVSSYSKEENLEYNFDFGNVAIEDGFIGVSASTAYTKELGYGFNTPKNMQNVVSVGTGANSDAVKFLTFGTKSENTFNVDLPKGLYEVEVTLGDTTRSSVAAESVYQIMNMTGNNAVDKFQVPITDGQLNILITEGKVGADFTLSALKIKRISDNPVTNKTIYLCGDSTTCNYYPLNTTVQAGWGQMLSNYINPKQYLIKNMATGGQIARGFKNDGQFESIMKYIKAKDVFMLDLGINDVNAKNNETEAEFKEYMGDMVRQAKEKGAIVILVTPHGKSIDFNADNIHFAQDRWYRHSTIELAQEEKVALVDMNTLSSTYFTSIGQTETLKLFIDNIHFNRSGADKIASIIAQDIEKQKILKDYSFINLPKK